MIRELEIEVVPVTGDPGEKSRIEFFTQQRRMEFGRFLYETALKIQNQNKESKKQ